MRKLHRIALKSLGGIIAIALATSIDTPAHTQTSQTQTPTKSTAPKSTAMRPRCPQRPPRRRLRPSRASVPRTKPPSFQDGLSRFADVESVTKGANNGLGPRFNSNQCLSCHSYPRAGGSSPTQKTPSLKSPPRTARKTPCPGSSQTTAPSAEARFIRNSNGTGDGEVHDLFVITGRTDAVGCNISQPDFTPAGNPLTGRGGNPNTHIFRIPTPVFGAGLIENIPDTTILNNMTANALQKKTAMGIRGHVNSHLSGNVNRTGNDGNHHPLRLEGPEQIPPHLRQRGLQRPEMGVTNQLFQQERDETPGCVFNATPEEHPQLLPRLRRHR